jgi:sigma-B regulation protein RsbU (phosphoserine phosphatase)
VARTYDLCLPVRPANGATFAVDGLQIADWLAVPIAVKNEIFGVMVLINPRHGERFSESDVEAARLLAGLAAVAIKNARLMAEEQKQARVQQQLKLARSVQVALLPDPALRVAGLEWQALYLPAFEIGGDYYDVIPLSGHEVLLVIGDVSSKGVPAALLMTAVRAMVRAEAARIADTAQLLTTVNRAVCSDFARDHEMFVTLFCARVNTQSRHMIYSNAGHSPPLVWGRGTEQPETLREGGSILGQLVEAEFTQGVVTLAPGWRLWAFTDGVTEARNARGELFGTHGVVRFAATHRSTAGHRFQSELKTTLDRFATERSDVDDLTSLWVADATPGSRHAGSATGRTRMSSRA